MSSHFALAQSNKMAAKFFKKGDHLKAIELYSKLVESNFESNDYFNLGTAYYATNSNPKEGAKLLETYIENADSVKTSTYFYLSHHYHRNYEFKKAIATANYFIEKIAYEYKINSIPTQIYEDFTKKAEELIVNCNYAIVMNASSRKIMIENLGDSINTPFAEYAPTISTDEKKLIFTSRRKQDNLSTVSDDGDYYESIYTSELITGSLIEAKRKMQDSSGFFSLITPFNYTKATPLSSKINPNEHEASIHLSGDGKKLYLYKNNDIYLSVNPFDTAWTTPEKLAIINSDQFDPSVFITADEQTMFISSEREGGYGNLDIYIAQKDDNNNWTTPKNLGNQINTEFDEDISYVSPDKKMIYFSSKGHSSMGGYDVFKAEFKNGMWSPPINMGTPLNSPFDDVFFVMPPKYNRGYYASERTGGKGKMDLYRLTFEDERNPLAELAGLVLRGDSLVPANSKIFLTLINDSSNTIHYSKKQTGEYLLLVEHGKKYEMLVETEGFAPYKKEITIPNQAAYYQLYQEIHHVYLRDSENNIIGQKIITHNAFEDIHKDISSDTLTQFFSKENYSKYVRDTLSKKVDKFIDVKFYMPEDSLIRLLKKDTNLNFIFPDNASVSFLYNQDKEFRYALNAYVAGKKINISYLKEKSVLINSIDNKADLAKAISTNNTPYKKPIVLLFEYEKYELNKKTKAQLKPLTLLMKKFPEINFLIKGHTDNKGTELFNKKLSNKRALQVLNYLKSQGINSSRLKYVGLGELHPIAPNKNIDGSDNPDGRYLNRRVEFELID